MCLKQESWVAIPKQSLSSINAAWDKLEHYYKITERASAWVASVVLDPNQKWDYFERDAKCEPRWVTRSRKEVKEYWEKEYKNIAPCAVPPLIDNAPEPQCGRQNSFREWQKQKRATVVARDEYEQYLAMPRLEIGRTFGARTWWQEPTQQRNFPNLSKMALDLLSIPAMSAEVERLFSSCKITITDRRNLLGIDTVEANECLKSWMRKNNIAFIDPETEEEITKREEEG